MSFPARLKRAFSSRSSQRSDGDQELVDRNAPGLSVRSVQIMNEINNGEYVLSSPLEAQ